MPLTKQQIKDSYPLPVYNYRVTIGTDTLGFSEVSGLNVAYEAVTYKHGLSFVMGARLIPGMRQPVKLTLKKGVAMGAKGSAFFAGWLKKVYDNPSENNEKDIFVDLCDETGKPVVRWTVRGALPVKLDAPNFTANSNDVALEGLELVAHQLEVNYNP